MFLSLNLNGKIHVIASLATENNQLDPVGKIRSFQSRMFPRSFTSIRVFLILSVLITQMFQTPALIGMTIAATRMYRSLTDYSGSRYLAYCQSRLVIILTTAKVLALSLPISLGSQIPNRSSKCDSSPAGWMSPHTRLPRIVLRPKTWATICRMPYSADSYHRPTACDERH